MSAPIRGLGAAIRGTPRPKSKGRRWEVATICIDLPATEAKGEPVLVQHADGSTIRRETIEPDNVLFASYREAWSVADMVESFWNRLNDRDARGPYGAHNPRALVKVLWVREVPR